MMFDENSNAATMAAQNGVGSAASLVASASPSTTGLSQLLNVKDSRWLQVEVCREFQRGQCARSDLECKFAHPPPHVDVQQGRVTACYDSIKGRCTRENPKCKYLHPPQHIKDQLLINGRNNLALKNLICSQMGASTPQLPVNQFAILQQQQAQHAALSANLMPTLPYPYYNQLLYSPLLGAASAASAVSAASGDPYQQQFALLLSQQQQQQQAQQVQAQHQQHAAVAAQQQQQQQQQTFLALIQQQQQLAALAAAQAAAAGVPSAALLAAASASSAPAPTTSRKRSAKNEEDAAGTSSSATPSGSSASDAALAAAVAYAAHASGVPQCKRPTVDKNGGVLFPGGAGASSASAAPFYHHMLSASGYPMPQVSFNGPPMPHRY